MLQLLVCDYTKIYTLTEGLILNPIKLWFNLKEACAVTELKSSFHLQFSSLF